jgi:membrane fusion protein (multidrug efflux system)
MQRPEPTPVTVAAVTNVAWDRTVSIVGTLYPKDEAAIASQVEGQVERTLVDFGDRVRTNQDLAFIDTASYEAQLEQAKGNLAKAEANFANAKQNFERTQSLLKQKIASQSDFDQAKAQLDQWDAEVRAARGAEGVARLNLQRSRVQAPFEGAISQRIVGRGDYVKTGSLLFTLVNDAVLKFIFQVPERYGSYVEKKLPVKFNVDNYPGETFTGSVYLISPSVGTSSRSFGVGALVTNTDFRLKASTFARGSLVLERGVPTPVVPLDAVVSFAGVTKVFVVENNVARSREVTVGRIREGLQEIVSGVTNGMMVAVTGQNRLTDGAAVAIQTSNIMDKENKPSLTKNRPSAVSQK